MTTDLFGDVATPPPFIDMRNQRPSAAEEKAQLCLVLNRMLLRAPKALGSASIQTIRAYKHAHKQALKVLQSKTSTRPELETAINTMRGFE